MKKKTAIITSKQFTKHADHYLANLLKKNKNFYVIAVIANISSANKNFFLQRYSKYFNEIYEEPDENNSIMKSISYKALLKKIKIFEASYGMSINNIFFTHRIIGGGFFSSGGKIRDHFALCFTKFLSGILGLPSKVFLCHQGLLSKSLSGFSGRSISSGLYI